MKSYYRGAAVTIAVVGSIFLGHPETLWAHGVEIHSDAGVQVEQTAIQEESSNSTLPIAVGGDFELVDHNGNHVSNSDYQGKHMMVFFGYVSCKNMCSITLGRISQALTLLGDSANKLSPLVITVDPERDTTEVMKSELGKYNSRIIGLTGTNEQLASAYASYKQKPISEGVDWDDDPVISHSSYIYLLDENGQFATLFPPILNPQSMADIIRKYIDNPA